MRRNDEISIFSKINKRKVNIQLEADDVEEEEKQEEEEKKEEEEGGEGGI